MKLKICKKWFSLQWNGTYYFALVDYPEINSWELKRQVRGAWKMYNRKTQIECGNLFYKA